MPHKFGFEAKNYPTEPGCYLMKDGDGTVIYVGKAKNLRRRLSSYFSATAHGKARRLAGERFPRCVIYRKNRVNKTLDGIEEINPPRRFGPYVSRRFRDALLDFVNEYFGLRVQTHTQENMPAL